MVGTSVAKPPARLSLVPTLLALAPPRDASLPLRVWRHIERLFPPPLHHFQGSPPQVSVAPLTRAPVCPSHVLPSIG